jgi:hypothetical protein
MEFIAMSVINEAASPHVTAEFTIDLTPFD